VKPLGTVFAHGLSPALLRAILGVPFAASLLLTAPGFLPVDCPWPLIPGADTFPGTLVPLAGWLLSLLAALTYAAPWHGQAVRPRVPKMAACAALAGVVLSTAGNMNTLTPPCRPPARCR